MTLPHRPAHLGKPLATPSHGDAALRALRFSSKKSKLGAPSLAPSSTVSHGSVEPHGCDSTAVPPHHQPRPHHAGAKARRYSPGRDADSLPTRRSRSYRPLLAHLATPGATLRPQGRGAANVLGRRT